MGWGKWYGYVWGGSGGLVSPFELLRARAVGGNVVRVTFNAPPKLDDPISIDDAARVLNWTLSRLDKTQKLTILTVRPVAGDPNSIELIIAERWTSKAAEYRLEAAGTILDLTLQKALQQPAQADFLGTQEFLQRRSERQERLFDLFNSQTEPDLINGGLEVSTDGDYQLESGIQLLKKLIIRRIVSAEDDFLHLAGTGYGFGAQEKELQLPTALASQQRRLKLQIDREPNVVQSSVSITARPDNVTIYDIKAQTDFGPLELSVDSNGVVIGG